MRIFDPKDQLGNSLLSSADTQKSSVKLEKQMAVGGGAITLTSEDISDIENWELSNARVKVDGQMISFLPDTSRDGDGNLVITLGETFSDVVLVLKRTVFDGMKQEEEDIIEVEIRQLMAKTMAAATAPTPREDDEIEANIAEWKAMGVKAYTSDPVKYANATREDFGGYEITGEGEVVVDDRFLSIDTLSIPGYDHIVVADTVTAIRWRAELPSLKYTMSGQLPADSIIEWTGKIPNIIDATGMFMGCSGLKSWTVDLPNSLTDARDMFRDCTGLTSWSVALPNSLTNAQNMFGRCTGLTSWTVELPSSLTNADSMFSGCTGLTEWTVALPDWLTDVSSMFSGCTRLTEWTVALPNSITDASYMFSGCSGLTSFQSDMPTWLKRNAQNMFYGCKLDITSVERISRTIANCTGTYEYAKTIHLGVSQACHDDTNYNTYINRMIDKGWVVVCTVNGSEHTHQHS